MTLREQIKIIHAKYLGDSMNSFRGSRIPMMLDDLAIAFFNLLVLVPSVTWMDEQTIAYWFLRDSVDVRAVKYAQGLLSAGQSISEDLPAIE